MDDGSKASWRRPAPLANRPSGLLHWHARGFQAHVLGNVAAKLRGIVTLRDTECAAACSHGPRLCCAKASPPVHPRARRRWRARLTPPTRCWICSTSITWPADVTPRVIEQLHLAVAKGCFGIRSAATSAPVTYLAPRADTAEVDATAGAAPAADDERKVGRSRRGRHGCPTVSRRCSWAGPGRVVGRCWHPRQPQQLRLSARTPRRGGIGCGSRGCGGGQAAPAVAACFRSSFSPANHRERPTRPQPHCQPRRLEGHAWATASW